MLLIVVQAGCASTKGSSFRDPSVPDKTYTCIIIFINDSNIAYRQQMENALSDKLSGYGVKGLKGTEIILPTQQYTQEEYNEAIKNTHCEALLTVTIHNTDANINYVPTVSGTMPITTGSATAKIKLYDIVSGKTVWMATANMTYNASPWNDNSTTMIHAYAEAVIDRMKEEKIVHIQNR